MISTLMVYSMFPVSIGCTLAHKLKSCKEPHEDYHSHQGHDYEISLVLIEALL
jgi:hypothetical protein